MAQKLFLLFQLSWINQESVICGSQHFFHPAEEDLPKSVLPGALFYTACYMSKSVERKRLDFYWKRADDVFHYAK